MAKKKTSKSSNGFKKANDLKGGKIDGMESGTWVMFTVIYAAFVSVLTGSAKVFLPEIIYIFSIPADPQQFVLILGIALWGVISILLKAHYMKS